MKTILRSAKSHSINVCKHTQPMTSGAEAQEILDFSSARPKPCPFKAIYQLLSRSSDHPTSNRFWSLCVVLLLVSTISYAAENGVLRGVVTDPAGAVVPRATVELLRAEGTGWPAPGGSPKPGTGDRSGPPLRALRRRKALQYMFLAAAARR